MTTAKRLVLLVVVIFGSVTGALAAQLPTPVFPNSPTSSAECQAVSREWSQISQEINDRHQQCLDSQACKNSHSGNHNPCSCGACLNLHNVMDRYNGGDLAQLRRAREQQCQQMVTAHQEQERRARQIEQENLRRAREQQADMDRMARQQQAQQQAALDQQRQQQLALQQQQQAQQQAILEQQRRQQQALYQQQQREAAIAEQQRRQQLALAQQQQAFSQQQYQQQQALAEQQRRQQLALQQQQLQPAPGPQPPPANVASAASPADARPPASSETVQRVRASMEQATARYDAIMGRQVQAAGVTFTVGDVKDALVSVASDIVTHILSSRSVVLKAVFEANDLVKANPVLELAGPFLDPENARNIYTSVEAARRQAQTGTMNENAARQLREVMAELDSQGR